MRVLLIEDNPGDIYLISMELTQLDPDLDLMIITRGQNAVNYIENVEKHPELHVPQLIILDSTLPAYSGLEILQKMQENKRLLPESVIIFSDIQNPDFEEAAFNLGVTDIFTKSADITVVQDRIRIIYEIAKERLKNGVKK